jgi:hypothetical protein
MPKNKIASLRQNAQAGRQQERSLPIPHTIGDRFAKLDALERTTAPKEAAKEVIEVEVEKVVPERLALDAIRDRVTNLRPVYEERARTLAGNIALFGIIQPIAVDLNNRLLAGDHRRRALQILRELAEWPDRGPTLLPALDDDTLGKAISAWRRFEFDVGIPIHRIRIDAIADPTSAKAIELSENTLRENFTKAEIQNAYKTLVAAGYRHTVGRPKKGEKAIGPQLELLYGRGSRTITKYIAEVRAEEDASIPQTATAGAEIDALRAMLPNASIRLGKRGSGSLTVSFASVDELKRLITRLSAST